MKIEKINEKKFEALSAESMTFVLGGYAVPSGGGPGYSNDFTTTEGNTTTNHISDAPGGDWSAAMMKHNCGELATIPDGHQEPPPMPGDELWGEWQHHIAIIVP